MKRRHFLLSDTADAEVRLAKAYYFAWRAALGFEANPACLALYRGWMREHAKRAVRYAQAVKVA